MAETGGNRPRTRRLFRPARSPFSVQAFGPVHVVLHWAKDEPEPLYLATNLELAQEACHLYARRMRIEFYFTEQKSRGFGLHKSNIHDPVRTARLLTATCLAYI